jgi:hypothetical protein
MATQTQVQVIDADAHVVETAIIPAHSLATSSFFNEPVKG